MDTVIIRSSTGAAGAPQLLCRDPIEAALNAMTQELETLRALAPSSDATAALERNLTRLTDAVTAAGQSDVWVASADAAKLRGCSASLIGKMARKGTLVAQKRGGTWLIHRDSVLANTRKAA